MNNMGTIKWKWIGILITILSSATSLQGQPASPEELSDLTERIMVEIQSFMDYVSVIGAAEESLDVRKRGIELCLELFTEDAVIEEQSKYSSYKKEWRIDKYLKTLLYRGENIPVLINFEVVDELLPEELKKVKNTDGSITYRGEMVFKQYYCKLKEVAQRKEPTMEEPDINCSYSDRTNKKVKIEIFRQVDHRGEYWVTKIVSIRVLRVY